MARPSKLSEKQWESLGARFLKGETASALGREFGISEAAIRKRLSAKTAQIKEVANQLATAELAFNALPISAKISARSLADDLRMVSEHLAGAAKFGSMTAHRLAGMAHAESDKIDDTAPLENHDALQGIAVLTKMANSSSEIGINLLRANKEFVDDVNKRAAAPSPAPSLSEMYKRLGTVKDER